MHLFPSIQRRMYIKSPFNDKKKLESRKQYNEIYSLSLVD